MPVLFTTNEVDGYSGNMARQAWGGCDECGVGSSTQSRREMAVRLGAQDRDGVGPWLCASCSMENGYTLEREHQDDLPYAEPDYCVAGAIPHYGTRNDAVADAPPRTRTTAGNQQPLDIDLDGVLNMLNTEPDDEGGTVPRATDYRNIEESYSFDTDYQPEAPRLLLPELPGRQARLISVEQEVGAGGHLIAEALYAEGYTASDGVLGYHSSGRRGSGFCHVEEDASVNAEVIYSKMNLSQPETARKLEGALNVVRQSISAGDSKLDMRCGMHVHVDAKGFGMAEIESLYHLWNHVEDTVFRLAAANWRCHRTSLASHNYATPTNKGLARRADIGRHFDGTRGALNMSNYLAARGNCRCGSFQFADWSDCRCDLGKATIEFRVFNATANLRKVHAYTALSLAMMEAARNVRFDSALDPFGFDISTETITVGMEEPTKRALSIIFEGLPLTEEERADLAYCARNSAVAEVYEEVYGA